MVMLHTAQAAACGHDVRVERVKFPTAAHIGKIGVEKQQSCDARTDVEECQQGGSHHRQNWSF